jgi:hypothetical protein
MLIDAASLRDGERFVKVCQANAPLILEHFAAWRVVPQDIRDQPEKLQRYGNALIQTAHLFERSGRPELLALLVGEQDNPLARLQGRFLQAQQLTDSGDHERSLAESEALLIDLEKSVVAGPGLLDLRAKLNGLRGTNLFALNRYIEAQAAMALALEDCERSGDEEGVHIYRSNLALLETHTSLRPELIDIELEVLEAFSRAQRLADLQRFKASNDVFSRLLAMLGDAANFVEAIRPHILGRMGFNEFKLGNEVAARALIEAARDLCSRRGDKEGAEVYAENLLAVERGESRA